MDARYEQLSGAHRRIAEYILANANRAAFMTAARVGRAVGVSESTVVRFAAALGYPGYRHLQRALQEGVRAQLTAAERLELTEADEDAPEGVLERVLRTDMDNIRATLQDLQPEAFRRALDIIERATRVFVVGQRSAAAVSYYLSFYLSYLRPHVIPLDDASIMFERLVDLGGSDAVVAVSFPRYSRLTYDVLKLARDRGAARVAITDSVVSPMARIADVSLTAHTPMVSFADSLVAPLSVANALITALALRRRTETQRTLEILERIWEQNSIYLLDE
ncbi:MAG: MurR/RpiR family transcriptional regulator [Thermaerobacter sp.]